MSTTTTNYSLIKPELTDAADITAMNANWDVIDGELTKKFDPNNLPDPMTLGAMCNLGLVDDSDLIRWAHNQTVGGSFLVSSTITTENIPIEDWFIGTLDVSEQALRISMSGLTTFKEYTNVTRENVFAGWVEQYTSQSKPNANDVGAVPKIATYYPRDTAMSADSLTVPFALVPLSADFNAELFSIMSTSFAYVYTGFYIETTVSAHRMQVAFSYTSTHPKMAFRTYNAGGWSSWREVVDTTALVTVADATVG